jgi:acetyl esterase
MMQWFWNHYLQDPLLRANPLASPLQATDEALRQFPPTLLVTCEYDVLRDEGEAFAARLIRNQVEVTAVRWLGALHGFLVTERLMKSPLADACIDLVSSYLRKGNSCES